MNTIPTSAHRLHFFAIPSLKPEDPGVIPPGLRLRIPTGVEKDMLTSRLVTMGVEQTPDSLMRAVMIDDLYNIYDDEEADRRANLLDSFWQLQEVEARAQMLWEEREVERLLDQQYGAPEIEAEVRPPSLLSPRHKAQAELYTHEMLQKSTRLRDLVKKNVEFQSVQNMALVRLHVASTQSMPDFASTPLEFEVDDPSILVLESAQRLRNALSDEDWADLVREIDGLYGLSPSAEKNSDSRPGKPSDPIGSPEPSAASESSDGSLTGSSIEPAPTAGSETTTGLSSGFTSAPAGQTSSPGRTEEA